MADIAKTWFMESSSNPGVAKYETIQYADGSTSCNCKGWTMKRSGQERQCKHTRAVDQGVADNICVSHSGEIQRAAAVRPQQYTQTQTKARPVFEKIKTRKIVL